MRLIRAILRLLLGIVALAGAYAGAGTIGGLIPVNTGWTPPREGVRIWIAGNGIHTDLILPVAAAGEDWRELVRREDFADPGRVAGARYLSFGWGDRDFYLATPSWGAIDPLVGAKALMGLGSTVLHAEAIRDPARRAKVRSLLLRPDEYRRLVDYVRGSFAAQHASRHGYGGTDAFYDARGSYNLFRTCNDWTGGALRAAGARMGAWTPFTFSVMFSL